MLILIINYHSDNLSENVINITYPTIFQIIREVVSEYGGEIINNIIISDLELTTKQLIKYIGNKYIHIRKDGGKWLEDDNDQKAWDSQHSGTQISNSWFTFKYGQDIGYQETDFTYPGEFKVNAGSTVTSILDKICQLLGNFEYFYDIDGHFIFQEKKNYLNTAYTPVTTYNGTTYIKNFFDDKYKYIFKDLEQTVSINSNPKYENIKNDFIVWGKKENGTAIMYHLAIDAKPQLYLANKYMWQVSGKDKTFLRYEYTKDLNAYHAKKDDIYLYYTIKKSEIFIEYFKPLMTEEEIKEQTNLSNYFYELALSDMPDVTNKHKDLRDFEERLQKKSEEEYKIWEEANKDKPEGEKDNQPIDQNQNYIDDNENLMKLYEEDMKLLDSNENLDNTINYELVARPCADWREELYRQALERSIAGLPAQPYDSELLSYWRSLYNSMPQNIKETDGSKKTVDWYNEETKDAWNPDVFNNPGALIYWLDFLDDGDELRKYSISAIGRRTQVQNSDKIRNIFNPLVEDILFIENNFSIEDLQRKIEYLQLIGQSYLLYKPNQNKLFSISSTGASAFDTIRDLIYKHLTYNTTVTINCLPKYYLEPNNLIHVVDTQNGVSGDYVITQFNLPLNYQGTMNITASEALIRI